MQNTTLKEKNFLQSLEKEIEVKKGTLKSKKILGDIPEWDSLAIMTFLSFADRKLKVKINILHLNKCKTTTDLYKLSCKKT